MVTVGKNEIDDVGGERRSPEAVNEQSKAKRV